MRLTPSPRRAAAFAAAALTAATFATPAAAIDCRITDSFGDFDVIAQRDFWSVDFDGRARLKLNFLGPALYIEIGANARGRQALVDAFLTNRPVKLRVKFDTGQSFGRSVRIGVLGEDKNPRVKIETDLPAAEARKVDERILAAAKGAKEVRIEIRDARSGRTYAEGRHGLDGLPAAVAFAERKAAEIAAADDCRESKLFGIF